jgi:hypothetical protein
MSAQSSEAERVEAAIADAVDAVKAGDRPLVAADWAAEKHDLEHRVFDIYDRVQEAIGDG